MSVASDFRNAGRKALRFYRRIGLLIALSIVSLLGGALIQLLSPHLRNGYTWLEPYRVLRNVLETRYFFAASLAGYLLGRLTRRDAMDFSALFFRKVAASPWRTVRALAAVTGFAADILLFPAHSVFDAIACGFCFAILTRPWPLDALRHSAQHMLVGTLVFSAVCYWFTVVKSLTLVDVAPRDSAIAAFEELLIGSIPHRHVATWSSGHPELVAWFDWAYFRIFHHMTLTLTFLLGLGDARLRTRYVASLAICYFLGALTYHLFPAFGPVYVEPEYFVHLRRDDLLADFMQRTLLRNTRAVAGAYEDTLTTWSYIASMPSLHMAHELVMLRFVWPSKIARALALMFSAFTAVAVVALGWHYPTDIVAGFVLGASSLVIAGWQRDVLLPSHLDQRRSPRDAEQQDIAVPGGASSP